MKRDEFAPPADLPPGYYVLPPGTVANAVTWMRLADRQKLAGVAALDVEPVRPPDFEAYRRLMTEIGAPLLWERASELSEAELLALFSRGDTRACVARRADGALSGLFELVEHGGKGLEIAYFGLAEGQQGRGLGKRLMAAALAAAGPAPAGIWLHTSSFDHPAAPGFYAACGFTAVAMGFEILRDPRCDGRLPPATAARIPMVRPDKP